MLLGAPESAIEHPELEPGAKWIWRRLLHSSEILTESGAGRLVRRLRDHTRKLRTLTTKAPSLLGSWGSLP